MKFVKDDRGVYVNIAAIATAEIRSGPAEYREAKNPDLYAGAELLEPKTINVAIGHADKIDVKLVNGDKHRITEGNARALSAFLTSETLRS